MAHQLGHGDITKRRLTNGHGITTSLWSASHIGAEPRPVPFQMPLSQYRAEAKRVSDDVKRRHDPSVRNMHLQKNYPETRKLLQPPRGSLTNYETPRELKGDNVPFPPHNMHRTKWDRNDKPAAQTQPKWCKAADDGFQFTHGHRNQLARRNNDANVNYIIAQHDRSGQPFKRGKYSFVDYFACSLSVDWALRVALLSRNSFPCPISHLHVISFYSFFSSFSISPRPFVLHFDSISRTSISLWCDV